MVTAMLRAALIPVLLAAPQEPASIDRLVAQLASPSWAEREAVAARILGLGQEAMPALERALTHPDSEVRHRASRLIDRLRWRPPPGLSEPLASAMQHYSSLPEQQRSSLVAKVAAELRSRAAPVLRQALRHDPSDAVRRQALDRLRRVDPAVAEVELRALAADTRTAVWAWERLGDLFYRAGKSAEAVAAFENARAAGSTDRRVALSLARVYKRQGHWTKARDLFAALVEAEPENLSYFRELGQCHYMLEDKAKAEAIWRRMLDARHGSPEGYIWLARAYNGIGATDKELAAYRQGCTKHSGDYELLRQFGRVLAREHRYDEAIDVLGRAIDASAADHQRRAVNVELTRVLRSSGRLDAYLRQREAGLAALDRDIAHLLGKLAERHLAAGRPAEARAALERLIALYPHSAEARKAAARLRRLGGIEPPRRTGP